LRRGLDHEGQIGGTRRTQPKRRGEDARVVRHRLRPAGILGERGGGDVQPRRQPGYESIDRLTHLHQASAGMAKQCELHSKAQTIGSAAPAHHEFLVESSEGVVPRESVRITRYAQQQPALLVG
jgi:hypothetical protein